MKDRRQRQLFPTPRGETLAFEVAVLQSKRFAAVFARLPEGARPQAIAFLLAMVDSGGRDKVAAMTVPAPPPRAGARATPVSQTSQRRLPLGVAGPQGRRLMMRRIF